MCSIQTDNGVITYDAVRKAMNGEPYGMSLTGSDGIRAVIEAVNQGIDSHLESCFCPERGDRYEAGSQRTGEFTFCHTLECRVSVESLPVLLRRLFDLNADDCVVDAAVSLCGVILLTLGFDENGQFVGREALGLAKSVSTGCRHLADTDHFSVAGTSAHLDRSRPESPHTMHGDESMHEPTFDLGQLVATPGALEALRDSGQCPDDFLSRHVQGDWGGVCSEDKGRNDQALTDGSRLLSVYRTLKAVTIWLITEAADDDGQRPATTILLPEEY